MSNKPFDRVVTHTRERPLSSDLNLERSQLAATQMLTAVSPLMSRSSLASFLPATSSSQFWGASFFPFAGTGMQVVLAGGWGWSYAPTLTGNSIGGISQVNDVGDIYPLYMSGSQAISVPTADATNPRIDIIEVKVDRRYENPLTRDVFNPATEVFDPTLLNKGLTYDLLNRTSINGSAAINYKTGTPAGVPAAPSVSAGYIKIAEVYVAAGVTSIVQSEIADYRPVAFPGGVAEFTARCTWSTDVVATPLTVSWGTCTPGFRVYLTSETLVYPSAGLSQFLFFSVLHPNLSGVTLSGLSPSSEAYLTGQHPISGPPGSVPMAAPLWTTLNGGTPGMVVVPTPSGIIVPAAGRNQPSASGWFVALTRSGAAFVSSTTFDVHIRAMVTP
jgi:hypothetical protein